jgi:hypothetical protein
LFTTGIWAGRILILSSSTNNLPEAGSMSLQWEGADTARGDEIIKQCISEGLLTGKHLQQTAYIGFF